MKWLRQHKWTLIISVLLFLGITNCQNLDQSKHSLSYSSYQIPSDKIDTPIRILQLTDLHNSEFGEDNQELIDRIASQSPDLILLTGDLLNSCHRDCYQFDFFSMRDCSRLSVLGKS